VFFKARLIDVNARSGVLLLVVVVVVVVVVGFIVFVCSFSTCTQGGSPLQKEVIVEHAPCCVRVYYERACVVRVRACGSNWW
jgi:hypothetical protein